MLRNLIASLAAIMLLQGPVAAQSEFVVDYVFLVDVSKSMNGFGGTPVIFPQVKERLKERIRQLGEQQTIIIQPFADGLLPGRRFTMREDADRQAALAFVDALSADGNNTYIYTSLLSTFRDYSVFRGDRTNRVAAVFVYTDGEDNGPGNQSMADMVRQFGLRRQPYDHLYYLTLGVKLPEADAAALDAAEYATHDESPRGKVRNPVIIEVRYPSLDFGNLQTAPDTRMEQRFRLRGALPPNFRLHLSTVFPAMREQNGPAAEVAPESVAPTAPVQFGLQLVNARNLEPRRYEGYIRFQSPDPGILVIPSSIPAYFAYEPPRFVTVTHQGRRGPVFQLGEADPFRSAGRRDSDSASLGLRYDPLTSRRGGWFRVRVESTGSEGRRLPEGMLTLNGRTGTEHRVNAPGTRGLELRVRTSADSVQPGSYEGWVILEPGDIAVAGYDSIPWRLKVADRPWPLGWVLAFWAGLAGLVLGAVRLSRPRLRGRLVVEEGDDVGRSLFLGSGTRVFIGPDATPVGVDAAVLTLTARGLRWMPRVTAEAEPDITLVRPLDDLEIQADTEELQEGDMLRVGRRTLRYTTH